MMNSKRVFARVAVAATVLLAAVAFATPARADLLLGMGFDDLNGTWVPGAPGLGTFTAVAVDSATDDPVNGVGFFGSSGHVQRFGDTPGFAFFDFGFAGGGEAAFSFTMLLSVTSTTTAVVLPGSTLNVTDSDGDTMTAALSGEWNKNGSSIEFDGQMTNILFAHDGTGSITDKLFNGAAPDGSANTTFFSFDFGSLALPFSGAIDSLSFPEGVSFFDPDMGFSQAVTSGDAQIIPAPGAFLLGAMGLAGVGWLKRRVA